MILKTRVVKEIGWSVIEIISFFIIINFIDWIPSEIFNSGLYSYIYGPNIGVSLCSGGREVPGVFGVYNLRLDSKNQEGVREKGMKFSGLRDLSFSVLLTQILFSFVTLEACPTSSHPPQAFSSDVRRSSLSTITPFPFRTLTRTLRPC